MKKDLLDVLFLSEKRKKVLLILKEGPKETDYLLKELGTTRQALLPQLRILEDYHLIIHLNDMYKLSSIGEILVEDIQSLLAKTDIFGIDINFWGECDLDFIPRSLFKKVGYLGECKCIIPHITEMYELNPDFHEDSMNSSEHYVMTTFMHPNFPKLVDDLVNNGVNVSFLISEYLFDVLKRKRYEDFRQVIGYEKVNVFVCSKELNFQYVSFNDHSLILSLFKKNGEISSKRMLCTSSTSLKWGHELFQHYMQYSKKITEI
ncbi:helix-turn-helix transcriptional regulator [Methanosalsum natronophilum]|uniref:helix-turn-helix transcriptional regulator n=1 Tax=Methanosalsum natronophilum TaxID=768733 RepID=UPI00216A04D7|nr:winged helix-turn-helix domain-containing protein [Methanosalsum natronophilum]MCS3924671.1 putative transcriptional regulator [Methanosalsum natronophilum]